MFIIIECDWHITSAVLSFASSQWRWHVLLLLSIYSKCRLSLYRNLYAVYTQRVKKVCHLVFAITSSTVLTNFWNSFTVTLCQIFAIKKSLCTLPWMCHYSTLWNLDVGKLVEVINYHLLRCIKRKFSEHF